MANEIQKMSNKYYNRMVHIRHEIHQQPELAYKELNTSRLVTEVLEEMGIEIQTQIAETGVVGLLRGCKPGRTVLLRADMDALPVQEDTGLPYASQIPGCMHACGHDGHVAGLLGAAMILNELRPTFAGNVKLVFQPAEESEGGALRMIQEGLLKNPDVDAAFGCHLWGSLEEGTMHICSGPMMAAVDTFWFRIQGLGGHGAVPHLAVDPITLAAQVISFMQTIVSRRIDPLEPAVLTLASIHSGSANNIIPEFADVTGTIRTFKPELRNTILREMESILKGITAAQGASYALELTTSYPAVHNDAGMVGVMSCAFAKILGEDHINRHMAPIMASEDFSYYTNNVPSAFAFIGIAKDKDHPVLHHHPRFQWDDQNLKILAGGLAQTALDFLASR